MKTLLLALLTAPSIGLAQSGQSPEFLCDLDGAPVPECLQLYKEASEHPDEFMRQQLRRRASEAWEAARVARDTRAAAPAAPAKFSLPVMSDEDKKRPPLAQYRSHIGFTMIVCKAAYVIGAQERTLGRPNSDKGDFSGCLAATSARARELYDKTAVSLKKPGAKQALKGVHVAFMTALEGIAPSLGELKIGYAARQAALEDRLNAAWASFDLER